MIGSSMDNAIELADFSQYIVLRKRDGAMDRLALRFPNGWGISIVRDWTGNGLSYGSQDGLWECGLLRDGSWYNADVAGFEGGVAGWCTPEDVQARMLDVFALADSEAEVTE